MITLTAISLSEFRSSGIPAGELKKLLPESSWEKLEKITNTDNNARSLLGELLSRFSISMYSGIKNSEIQIDIADKGKPHLKDHQEVHFNITHSGEMVACAVDSSDIGIDIEHFRKVNFRVAERFFSPSEIQDLLALDETLRQEYFFTLWTIKESFLKAIGSGLTRTLNSFSVVNTNEGYSLKGDELSESFHIKTYTLPGPFHLAVCSRDISFPQGVQLISMREIFEILA
jgi:4'-phosphopantetheinyl transferase